MISLSSLLMTSLTRSRRCFITTSKCIWLPLSRYQPVSLVSASGPPGTSSNRAAFTCKSQLLSDFLEIITFNDVAHLVFGKVAEFKPTFDTGSHLFNIVLEAAQSRETSIINSLPATQDSGSSGADNSSVRNKTPGYGPLGKFENLPDFGMAHDAFPDLGIEHSDHRFLHLVEQLVNNTV